MYGIYDTVSTFWASVRERRNRPKRGFWHPLGPLKKIHFPCGRLANATNSGLIAETLQNTNPRHLSEMGVLFGLL